MSKLLAALVYQEVYYQILLLTSVTEPRRKIVLWDKIIFYQCCLQPNALNKHTSTQNSCCSGTHEQNGRNNGLGAGVKRNF